MKNTALITLAVVACLAFGFLAWWDFQPTHKATETATVTNTAKTTGTNSTLVNTSEEQTNTSSTSPTNDGTATNANIETATEPKNTNIDVNSNTDTGTSTATTGVVSTFFADTVNTWRQPTKVQTMPNGRKLSKYAYNLPIGSHVAKAAYGVQLASVETPVTNDDTANTLEVVSADTWNGHVPSGHAFLKVDWFCSAALTHITNATGGASQLIGDYTGDCYNSNVSVKGNFMPTILGDYTPSKPFLFRFSTEYGNGAPTSYDSSSPGKCTIDRIQNAGARGIFAMQYSCGDGISGGVNMQFTAYVFPNSWRSPSDALDLLTTADKNSDDDGDGFTYVQELTYKTNPNNSDTDYDGLGDFEEVKKYMTNPVKADSDGDGVKDGAEVAALVNPLGSGPATAEQIAAWNAAPNQPGKTTISDIRVTYKNGSAIVTWKVSPNADGIVNWGPTTAYGQYLSDYNFIDTHTIGFPVASGATMHYAIRSCTPAPNSVCAVSADLTYTAP